jgi:hypothetical protein
MPMPASTPAMMSIEPVIADWCSPHAVVGGRVVAVAASSAMGEPCDCFHRIAEADAEEDTDESRAPSISSRAKCIGDTAGLEALRAAY